MPDASGPGARRQRTAALTRSLTGLTRPRAWLGRALAWLTGTSGATRLLRAGGGARRRPVFLLTGGPWCRRTGSRAGLATARATAAQLLGHVARDRRRVALDVDAHLRELVDQILVRYAKFFGD